MDRDEQPPPKKTQLQDLDAEEVKGGCWPKKWKVNAFDGKGDDVVTVPACTITRPGG